MISNMILHIITILFLLTVNLKGSNTVYAEYNEMDDNDIKYHVYDRNNPNNPNIIQYGDEAALNISSFNPRHGTIAYIHGWLESVEDTGAHTILRAYLQFMDYNIILVDWTKVSRAFYFFHSAPNSPAVGASIAKMMTWLEDHNRINISDLHLIGFSLGAHVAGFTGKALAPRKIRRITGLDPAHPAFEGHAKDTRLDKSDADFVDIIHTESTLLGIKAPVGHADFYPNYGVSQPNCLSINIGCSHLYAWKYYAESISNPNLFPAFKCDFKHKTVRNCQIYNVTIMGHYANPKIHGIFYVNITDISELPESLEKYANFK